MNTCHDCTKELQLERKPGRTDTCPYCKADLHCCLNCSFYDPDFYNQCRETQADRVLEKGKSNFCDYFFYKDSSPGKDQGVAKQKAKNQLNDLFKKK